MLVILVQGGITHSTSLLSEQQNFVRDDKSQNSCRLIIISCSPRSPRPKFRKRAARQGQGCISFFSASKPITGTAVGRPGTQPLLHALGRYSPGAISHLAAYESTSTTVPLQGMRLPFHFGLFFKCLHLKCPAFSACHRRLLMPR